MIKLTLGNERRGKKMEKNNYAHDEIATKAFKGNMSILSIFLEWNEIKCR